MNNNNPSSNPMGHIVVIASMCLVSNASFPCTSRFAWLSYIIGPAPLKRAHNQCNKRIVVHGIFLPSTNHPLLLPCSALLCSALPAFPLLFHSRRRTEPPSHASPPPGIHIENTREKKKEKENIELAVSDCPPTQEMRRWIVIRKKGWFGWNPWKCWDQQSRFRLYDIETQE